MVVAIIQARLGSSRLPGKVLKEVTGQPLLKIMVDRVLKANLVTKVVVATTSLVSDAPIVEFCKNNLIEVFCGDENDVLSRYYACARFYKAHTIVRLTADCPLIDPAIIDKTVKQFLSDSVDYCANTVPPETTTFPDGSDVEVFSFDAIERAYNEAAKECDREHVTFYFWKYGHAFKTSQVKNASDFSSYRFTVDYPEDFQVVTLLIETLKQNSQFGDLSEIVAILQNNEEIRQLNAHYFPGIGWGQSR